MYYLGTIVTVVGASQNNSGTAVPFVIPQGTPRVVLVTPTDASGLGYNVTVGIAGLGAGANDFNIAGQVSAQFNCPVGFGGNPGVAIFVPNGGSGGSVKVYGVYGLATS